MKNKELFDKSIGILVKAYMNDTLVKGNCSACAVGNLVVGNLGYNICKNSKGKLIWDIDDELAGLFGWFQVFGTDAGSKIQHLRPWEYKGEAKKQIDSTGYHFMELAKIESAFEAGKGMFEGLMNVVEVLGKIHEIDFEEIEQTKALFVK